MTTHAASFSSGALLPESILHHNEFAILAAFVAVNTLMYGALAFAKVLPKIYFSDVLHRKRRRSETRSIHPDVGLDSGESDLLASQAADKMA